MFTRLLSTENFGKVSVFNTWNSILSIIAMFALSYGVFNNGMLDYKDDRDEYSFSMLVLSNIITFFSAIVFLIFYHSFAGVFDYSLPVVIFLLLGFFLQPAYNFWMARQRYEYKYKLAAIFAILNALVSPVFGILGLLLIEGDPAEIKIITSIAPLLMIYVCFYIYLIKKAKCNIKVKYWKFAFFFNLPLIPHYLSSLLLGSSDKIMISYLVGDSQTAFYSVAYSVASVVTIVWSAANSSLIPYTYEKCEQNDFNSISNVTNSLLVIFAIACGFLIFIAPEVVSIMAPSEYREAIYVIPPIVGGVFFQVQYFIYANVLYFFKRPKYVMYASVSSMLINIILNYFLIPRLGYLVAGYTTLGCYILQALIDHWALKRVMGKEIYNMRFIYSLSIIMILFALFSSFIYNYPLLRMVVLLLGLLCVFIFKDKIMIFKKKVMM